MINPITPESPVDICIICHENIKTPTKRLTRVQCNCSYSICGECCDSIDYQMYIAANPNRCMLCRRDFKQNQIQTEQPASGQVSAFASHDNDVKVCCVLCGVTIVFAYVIHLWFEICCRDKYRQWLLAGSILAWSGINICFVYCLCRRCMQPNGSLHSPPPISETLSITILS